MIVIFRGVAIRGAPATYKARLTDDDGDLITQADISAVSWKSFDRQTGTEVATGNLTVANVIFDALQAWEVDSTGFNFRHTIPAEAFPSNDKTYRLEYKFTPIVGEPGYILGEIESAGRFTP